MIYDFTWNNADGDSGLWVDYQGTIQNTEAMVLTNCENFRDYQCAETIELGAGDSVVVERTEPHLQTLTLRGEAARVELERIRYWAREGDALSYVDGELVVR